MQLQLPGRKLLALMSGTDPIRQFNPGWQAESLLTLLDPVWLLVLRHESGAVATWHVDSSGVLCAPPRSRPAPEPQEFAARLRRIGLWLRHAPGAPIRLAVPEPVRAYLALPRMVQDELDGLLDADRLVPALPDAALLADSLREDVPEVLFLLTPGTNGYLIGNPGALVPLMVGASLAELQPGWRIASIETDFTPLLAVVLHHQDGHEATWFVGLDAALVSHSTSLLPQPWLEHLVHLSAPLFSGLWDRLVLDIRDLPPHAETVARLPSGDLAALVPLHLAAAGRGGETRVWTLDVPPPPGLAYVVPTRHGLRALDAGLAMRAVVHGIHGEMDRLISDGRMIWPSPIDGSPVESDGFAFLLDQHNFAYRFRHEAADLVFYVVCTGTYFYNHALYFPAADLLVASKADLAASCRTHFARGQATLLHHLVAYQNQLDRGEKLPRDPVIQQFFGTCATHIGHYVWQDLSGMTYQLRRKREPGRLPHLQMFSSDVIQAFFGPEERIFPVLEGRITRHRHGFDAHIGTFYELNQRVIRYNAISVPAELGTAVVAAANGTPELREACEEADAARRDRGPVILFGIRVGNRTMADLEAFSIDLLRHLGRSFPGCTVVLDGLNDQHDRGRAVQATTASGSDLDQEFALAELLSAIGEEVGVQVVDNINRSALRSVVWCSRADGFVALLGAALSKYRWICNTPGLVLSSRWNLEHRADLHIYDAPAALEGSSEMLFNTVDEVQDISPDVDAGGFDGRGNFVVSREPVFDRLSDLVRRHAAIRTADQ